jgi:hypothetical protein
MVINNVIDLRRAFVECAKQLKDGVVFVLTFEVYDEKTREQEKKYHAMLGDIAEQAKHLNQVLSADDWKRLCVAQYRTDCITNEVDKLADYWNKQNFRLIPSLDGGSVVALGAQTRKFPKYVAAGFIEWLYQYGAANNIRWTDERVFSDYELQRYGT